jgi:hypothetical protein
MGAWAFSIFDLSCFPIFPISAPRRVWAHRGVAVRLPPPRSRASFGASQLISVGCASPGRLSASVFGPSERVRGRVRPCPAGQISLNTYSFRKPSRRRIGGGKNTSPLNRGQTILRRAPDCRFRPEFPDFSKNCRDAFRGRGRAGHRPASGRGRCGLRRAEPQERTILLRLQHGLSRVAILLRRSLTAHSQTEPPRRPRGRGGFRRLGLRYASAGLIRWAKCSSTPQGSQA